MDITVYTTPTCTQCPGEITRLRTRGIDPTIVDVTADPAGYDLLTSLGYQQVPVIVRRDAQGQLIDHWRGHRPDKLLGLTRS